MLLKKYILWRWTKLLSLASIAAVLVLGQSFSDRDDQRHSDEDSRASWPTAGRDFANSRDNPSENRLNRETVPYLKTKWVFQTAGDVSATPTVEGDSLYVPDWGGFLYKINNRNGKAVWSHKLSEYTGLSTSLSRNSPAIAGDLLIFGDQASANLIAVDKFDGHLVWKTLLDSNAEAIVTNSPLIVKDRIFVGVASNEEGAAARITNYKLSFRGSALAVDLNSGSILWRFYTVPEGYTGGAVWGSTFAYDTHRKALYVTSGNNYSVPADVTACQSQTSSPAGQFACLAADDYIDSVASLDIESGKPKWVSRLGGADAWIVSCLFNTGGSACPNPAGPDYDFGSGANLIHLHGRERRADIVGAGQKSGVYWALDPDTGTKLWATTIGPGGTLGGIEWGSAEDDKNVYVAITNSTNAIYTLQPGNQVSTTSGSWAALDAATGNFRWQVPVPGTNPATKKPAGGLGALSVANKVLYAGSLAGDMVALDAESGKTLWQFASGGSVASGPSIVDGTVYWGSGYSRFGVGTGNNKLFAFSLSER